MCRVGRWGCGLCLCWGERAWGVWVAVWVWGRVCVWMLGTATKRCFLVLFGVRFHFCLPPGFVACTIEQSIFHPLLSWETFLHLSEDFAASSFIVSRGHCNCSFPWRSCFEVRLLCCYLGHRICRGKFGGICLFPGWNIKLVNALAFHMTYKLILMFCIN